ncbi:hypothetical protein DERP_006273 [Dermatophagoides pteronyssinus]|uniref:Uncharacterized protein n=1 Tax=Dermatophagoides pteronyssinus TaxID=6956 RepID=A0ABQ8IYB2_DERPT|nr:hypothetical protein DERP_006273 [Dermatophagoides pteronyssinus]
MIGLIHSFIHSFKSPTASPILVAIPCSDDILKFDEFCIDFLCVGDCQYCGGCCCSNGDVDNAVFGVCQYGGGGGGCCCCLYGDVDNAAVGDCQYGGRCFFIGFGFVVIPNADDNVL